MGMKLYIGALVVVAAAAGTAGCLLWKKKQEKDRFNKTWAALLQTDAKVYIGLFDGLRRVADGSAKKPEKVLREWRDRTHFKWEGSEADALCTEWLFPAIEKADASDCAELAKALLLATQKAGIQPENKEKLVLDETTVHAYEEWDGVELYPGDTVAVKTDAWYQNGRLLEKGYCQKLNDESA